MDKHHSKTRGLGHLLLLPAVIALFIATAFAAAPEPAVSVVSENKDGSVTLRVSPAMAKQCSDPALGGCVLVTQKQVYEAIKQTTHALCGKEV